MLLIDFLSNLWLLFLLAANVALRVVPKTWIIIVPIILLVLAVVHWRATIVIAIAAIVAILLFTPIGSAFIAGFRAGFTGG
jgi:hypothetical protein